MTNPDDHGTTPMSDLDRRLSDWLDSRAPARAPEHLFGATVFRTARTRPRAAWRIPERWHSMTIALRPAALPRGLVFILLALGLVLALLGGGLMAGGLRLLPAAVEGPVAGSISNGVIAVASGDGIRVVEPGLTEVRTLVDGRGMYDYLTWSRDGTRLAYWHQANPLASWQLVTVDEHGGDPITVATSEHGVDGLSWSPDGQALTYAARTAPRGDGECLWTETGEFCSSRIFVASADGSGAQQVGPADLDARAPTWSPDGASIAFGGGDAATDVRLYVMAPDGNDARQVGSVQGSTWAFVQQSWSPDGTQITAHAPWAEGSLEWDVWVFEADGSGEQNVSNDRRGDEITPLFGPDGSIAWTAGGIDGMAIRHADGTIVEVPGFTFPAWSPDGQLLAAYTDESGDLHVIDTSGATFTVVQDASTTSGTIAWQPVLDG